jgi:hypothetical protein
MKTKIAKLALGVVLFALVAAPRFVTAAVVVAEPTGDADPAFLSELKASLETVAADAPAEMNAELRSSATVTDAGVELIVELVLPDRSKPHIESRVVSRESVLSEAQAMARAAIGGRAAPKPQVTEESPTLPVKYDRRKALLMTVLPTALSSAVGGSLIPIGLFTHIGFIITGSVVMGTGLIFGPSIGYFWIGRTRHALMMSGLRFLTLATGVTAMVFYIGGMISNDTEGDRGSACVGGSCGPSPALLVLSIASYTATLLLAFVDAALVGRAADRANTQWRERKRIEIQASPVVWSSGNGDGTFGLAVSGTF